MYHCLEMHVRICSCALRLSSSVCLSLSKDLEEYV